MLSQRIASISTEFLHRLIWLGLQGVPKLGLVGPSGSLNWRLRSEEGKRRWVVVGDGRGEVWFIETAIALLLKNPKSLDVGKVRCMPLYVLSFPCSFDLKVRVKK